LSVGRHVDARLSQVPGAFPNVVLDGAQPELDVASLWRRSIGAALCIVLVAAAYVAAYRLQSEGLGWTFLSFGHPLLVCPLVLFGYILGLRLLGRLLQADARGDALKYRGIGVEARVLKVRQTGTYLNEQPQVEFQLEYTDRDGRVQQVSVRRFIPLIDLANIPRETVTLLYDPDDRGNVRLEGV